MPFVGFRLNLTTNDCHIIFFKAYSVRETKEESHLQQRLVFIQTEDRRRYVLTVVKSGLVVRRPTTYLFHQLANDNLLSVLANQREILIMCYF